MSNATHGGSTAHGHRAGTSAWPTGVQKAAAGVGAVFVLVAILGFIPGLTTNFSQMSMAGANSEARLLGVFQVSVLHNLVHLALGVAGLAMARSRRAARSYLVGGGIIYLAVWLYGLLVDKSSPANFIPVNSADDWLHFALGAAMVVMGLALGNRGSDERLGQGRH
jgi:hypothetical protein